MVKQKTIKKTISISGIGLHTGKKVSLTINPAKENAGIVFVRTDLPGKPKITANIENVKSTVRGTNLGDIFTVEHLLSALYAFSISNAIIEMDGPEPPALDGSSKQYCELIAKAGVQSQKTPIGTITVTKPFIIGEGGKSLIAMPSDSFRIGFMINYPNHFIGSQYFRAPVNKSIYVRDIAPARTYGFVEELDMLKESGLALGASEENAVAISKSGYLTELRFKDELVRHKVLDLIGDLALLGKEIKAHIIGVRSGHDLNIKLAKRLKEVG
jgi:UDP-3-O-acyl N-acetylglucosamine deacetylase